MDNRIRKFLDPEHGVRAALVDATDAVREMQKTQKTLPLATVLMGRAMAGVTLMASHLKDGEVISLYIRGDGPIGTIFAEAGFDGGVRGYVAKPHLELPFRDNRLDLGRAIGKGTLTVVRAHPQRPYPQKGTVEIQTGEIGDDIAYYLQQSEQTRSAIALGVKLNLRGEVEAAGGILIELLPAATAMIETIVEDQFVRAGSISESLARGDGPAQILDRYLGGFSLTEIEHHQHVNYTCRCSRDRLLTALELFKNEDLDDMIMKKEPVVAKCEFCGRQYSLDWTEIKDVRFQRLNKGTH